MVLFDHGDLGSKFWRIPALAVAPDGTLVAVADKRNDSNGDLPNRIDLGLRRSTDGGLTWSEPEVIVYADSVGGYGDPALGVHRPTGDMVIVAAHGNGLWVSTPENHQHLVVLRSKDNGATWSEPVDITAQLYDPWPGVSPLTALEGFASSGTLLCDANGRLMFVLVAHCNDQKWGPLGCYVAYSDDGGYTWSLTDEVDDFGDESKVAQLADGSYLMSIRNRHKNGRKLSRSSDGIHWTVPMATHQLIDPACNGDLIALSEEQLRDFGLVDKLGDDIKNGLLLHSMANDPSARRNVTVLSSRDFGMSWKPVYVVQPDRSSYSALAVMPDGTLGIFSEEDNPEGGFTLWFTKVNLSDLDF